MGPKKGDRAAILQLHKMAYHDQLCRDMGVNPLRKGWNLLSEVFAPYSAADYVGLFARSEATKDDKAVMEAVSAGPQGSRSLVQKLSSTSLTLLEALNAYSEASLVVSRVRFSRLKQFLWRVVPSLSAEASLYSGRSPGAFAQGVSVVAAFSLAAPINRKSPQGRPSRLPCQCRSILPAEAPM